MRSRETGAGRLCAFWLSPLEGNMRIVILTIAMLAVGPALGGQLDGVETLGNPDAIAAKAAAQFRYVQIWKDGGAMQARCEARQFAS
jgi:hypothetical protein